MPITQDVFGKTAEGEEVNRYILKNKNNVTIRILDYGGIVTDIIVPDKNGKMDDINLGFDNIKEYDAFDYMGGLIGRVANRIAGGQFTLDGKTHKLTVNSEPNALHGGVRGFDKRLWQGKIDDNKLRLRYVSKDGEEHYPGELTLDVVYELTDDNELIVDYTGTTTAATPINVTNHAHFNLGGHGSGRVDDHVVTIWADNFLPLDENSVPIGEVQKVDGTEWDLRKPKRIGDHMGQVPGGKGFDNTFVLSSTEDRKLVAKVEHPGTGRWLKCYTTEPAVQFYTGFYLTDVTGKGGAQYCQYGGLSLEAQHYPNSVNESSFPSVILRPGEKYRQTTTYVFGTNN